MPRVGGPAVTHNLTAWRRKHSSCQDLNGNNKTPRMLGDHAVSCKAVVLGREGRTLNYSPTDAAKLSELHSIAASSFRDGSANSKSLFGFETAAQRRRTRLERDLARGYSVNVKQVVLAFAVEFWIIGLIIVGTYLLIAQSADRGHVSSEEVYSALLLPAALAMVELARVPLAIAVRTQPSFHIKFLASLGVVAAITVTSFSLSQIAWKTFDIRTAEAVSASNKVSQIKAKREELQAKTNALRLDLDHKLQERNTVSSRLAGLQQQLTKITSTTGQSCKPLLDSEGKPLIGQDGKVQESCTALPLVNRAQLNVINSQITNTQKELQAAQVQVTEAEQTIKAIDTSIIDDQLSKAEAEYRAAVDASQLYSYAGMLTGKASYEVTEADVKRLEKYLIIIPAIAAAFASTLLAVTAVRRLRAPEPPPLASIPDDAAKYLFGPLLEAIKAEAKASVAAAINSGTRTAPS